MTDSEIITNACELQKRFNEILYAFPNNSTDGIENLSDLKRLYDNNLGTAWQQNLTYNTGDIISYKFNVYVSLIDSNSGNIPDENGNTNWQLLNVNTLASGYVYAAASLNARIHFNNDGTFDYVNIYDSVFVESVEYTDRFTVKITFSDLVNLYDLNYQVIFSNGRSNGNTKINLIDKTNKSVYFKFSNTTIYLSLIIVPVQKQDIL